ncbi:MAG: hypothetical protein KQH59_20550 [Desulfobulbaceae bacterium]|nr:hypothetical protein [Desulfobulbaceae bacterium]
MNEIIRALLGCGAVEKLEEGRSHFLYSALRVVYTALVFLLCAGYAHSACDPMTYRESQDSAFQKFCGYGSVIIKDNNVWVFNEAARKRFGMPQEWQDDGLKGAELAAFRIEPSGRLRCHNQGDKEVCVPSYECVIELYIKSDIDIGITGNPVVGLIPWKSSLFALGELNPDLKGKWEQAFGLKRVYLQESGQEVDGGAKAIGYDATREKDLIIVTLFIDGRFSLLPTETKRTIRFPLSGGKVHEVEFPPSFWQRIIEYHQARSDLSDRNWYGGKEVDKSLWVYTADFAQRYNMPLTGVNEELEGVLAVAYNHVPTGRPSCGYFSDASTCTKSRLDTIFEFYLDPSARISYPSYDGIVKSILGSSTTFLHEQDKYNKRIPEIDTSALKFRTTFIYRSNKTARENIDKWFGWGSGYFQEYIDHSAWGLDFSLLALDMPLYDRVEAHEQNFICFTDADKCLNDEEVFNQTTHVVHLPIEYIYSVDSYDKAQTIDEKSAIGVVRNKLNN